MTDYQNTWVEGDPEDPTRPVCYTTEHELEFLRGLLRKGKRQQLRMYRRAIAYRTWKGRGMDVDKSIIEAELNRMLGKAANTDEPYRAFAQRSSLEWLGWGHLRAIIERNTREGDGQ